jgi:hypothetical protein
VARQRITEQDDRFITNKAKVEKDPAGMQARVIINLEDLADATDDIKEQLVAHCTQPADKAHPASTAAPMPETSPTAGLSHTERYKLAAMEHRGKIIAGIATIVVAILGIAFKQGGI